MNHKRIFIIKRHFFLLMLLFMLACKDNAKKNEPISNHQNQSKIIDDTERTFDFLPTLSNNQVVVHENYTLSYNETYEQADWVAYFLDGKTSKNHFERPFFEQDPLVKTGSADWKNYKKSGYDKGHLCPAGDMKSSEKAFEDTFFTSNISPQRHDFNEGIWNRLEQKTRYWATKYNGIYIITAGVLSGNLETIGHEDVAVPQYFYKILYRASDSKMIGFLVPHADSDQALYDFVVPVDKIEQITGLDFFPKLDDKLENQLEQKSNWKEW